MHCVEISIHALLAESDLSALAPEEYPTQFLSTLSLRRATNGRMRDAENLTISIHALLAESDAFLIFSQIRVVLFLSTLSLRRATAVTTVVVGPSRDFYPRSPCGERQVFFQAFIWDTYFYPRSPCGERPLAVLAILQHCRFLSTLSLRRATPPLCFFWRRFCHFYPRSPCGERHGKVLSVMYDILISIHALLAESDSADYVEYNYNNKFLSTLSSRRAT